MTVTVDASRCIGVGAACSFCTQQGPTWFRPADTGRAECHHQPASTDEPAVQQIINVCPTGAITATVESGSPGGDQNPGGTGQLPPPNHDE